MVTGKEDDATAALAAEASLKAAIDKIFADILKFKRDSALVVQNQLERAGNMLRYKLDDLPSIADDAELQRSSSARKSHRSVPGGDRARQRLRHQFRPDGRNQRDGAIEVCRNSLHAISSKDEKIVEGLKAKRVRHAAR